MIEKKAAVGIINDISGVIESSVTDCVARAT